MCMRQREVVDITILACGSPISEKLRCTLCTNERTWLLTLKVAPKIHGTPCRTQGGWRVRTLLNGTFHGVFFPCYGGHPAYWACCAISWRPPITHYSWSGGRSTSPRHCHTTHLLQPLDVGVFGPLKHVWSKILKEFKMETMAAKVD